MSSQLLVTEFHKVLKQRDSLGLYYASVYGKTLTQQEKDELFHCSRIARSNLNKYSK